MCHLMIFSVDFVLYHNLATIYLVTLIGLVGAYPTGVKLGLNIILPAD